ncbi:MAG TPA: hypothetical protein VK689_10690 [Armatimonadota bacterium]|nr:hypothetical protein [Armatimonadota bacterium]
MNRLLRKAAPGRQGWLAGEVLNGYRCRPAGKERAANQVARYRQAPDRRGVEWGLRLE